MAFKAGKCAEPPRMAQVTIMFSACDEPFLEDYLVGPLPVSENTTAVPYSFRTTKGTSRITNYDADADKTQDFIVATAQTCDDIITDLLGAPADSWDIWGIDPLWHEDGRVISTPASFFLGAFHVLRRELTSPAFAEQTGSASGASPRPSLTERPSSRKVST
jgi:hypothetical protein